MVANSFVAIANGLGPEITKTIVHVFVNLLQDSEVEVRTMAASKISGVSRLLTMEEVVHSILPCVNTLITDQSQQVRKSLASDIMMLSTVFGNDGTNQHLLPIFLKLLKDDVPEVRLNVISKLDQVTPVIGLDKLSEYLIPAIVELAKNQQWRIRLSVITYIPPLARQLSVEFFSDKLGDLCYAWLTDDVCAIRQAAVTNLKELTQVFGEEFTRTCVIPKISELKAKNNYLHRITVLRFVSQLAPVLTESFTNELLLPLVLSLANDPVPNIRFSCAAALEAIEMKLDRVTKETQVKVVLERLAKDEDSDVCLYAVSALKNLTL
eukprot:TRINITY_DN563_c0_g1_i11.p1 TRINITY_DN563_c0_g1~~TRINITY_DN563_c0_g1_i11.p1  ORF type:complete len:323 (-),score=47.31 TRINITY_DN563_c0_g1_i11:270-1238(-)